MKLLKIFLLLALLPAFSFPAQALTLKLATTTSTQNSGLLQHILPNFEKKTHYSVHVIAVGTGKALRMGKDGDVDVVLVHARPAENKFVAAGYGVNRRDVMYNDFVIVGPSDDPAHIKGMKNAAQALKAIAKSHAIFVSRGDDSGTNKKEKHLWDQAHIQPSGKWYREAGQGMGKVLQMTDELNGYTLTDRGTWLAYTDKLKLHILVQGDPKLFNPYGVIAVNPSRYKGIDYMGAMEFIAWLTSPSTQQLIADYRLHGKQLFTPDAYDHK